MRSAADGEKRITEVSTCTFVCIQTELGYVYFVFFRVNESCVMKFSCKILNLPRFLVYNIFSLYSIL